MSLIFVYLDLLWTMIKILQNLKSYYWFTVFRSNYSRIAYNFFFRTKLKRGCVFFKKFLKKIVTNIVNIEWNICSDTYNCTSLVYNLLSIRILFVVVFEFIIIYYFSFSLVFKRLCTSINFFLFYDFSPPVLYLTACSPLASLLAVYSLSAFDLEVVK